MEKLLAFKDAPMFRRVMEDKSLCKGVIECILGIEIDDIEYQSTEEEIEPYIDSRGVRLDAYVKATGQVFDIEIQTSRKPLLGRRMRYYQAAMDTAIMGKGSDWDMLPESFIIFICTYDHYKRGLPVYQIERTCKEDATVDIDDASHWVVLNAKAWNKDINASRSKLLQYIMDGRASDKLTEGLASAVRQANDDAEWRERAMGFMTQEMDHAVELRVRTAEAREEGIAEGEAIGEAKGQERYSKLIDILLAEKRIDDLKRAADDPAYRQSLFEEFNL